MPAEMARRPSTLPRALRAAPVPDVYATQARVRRALREGRAVVAYQPVVDARALSRVSYYEALIRLQSPNGTLLAPDQFLPAIAGTPLAAAIDLAALKAVLAKLRQRGDLRLAVNICSASLENSAWLDALRAAAARAPDIAYRLVLEITEDAGLLDHPAFPDFMATVDRLGVTLALDDFGAGATGFATLRAQRVDMLKIDGSYGAGLAHCPDAQALVGAMVEVARHFDMMTVIEHIDDPADAHRAMAIGVDCLQGFMFGRPAREVCDRHDRGNTADGQRRR
ncbi:MAG: EAL domain-containing protein [Pseudomonadota bacterium]